HGQSRRVARTERGDEATGRELLDRRDGRGGGDRVTRARHGHATPHTDALGALDDAGDGDPNIGVERRRVEDPDALVAEVLGDLGVVDDALARREGTREGGTRHSWTVPSDR